MILIVGDLTLALLDAVATCVCGPVIEQMCQYFVVCMATSLAPLTDPVDVTRFAREVTVLGFVRILFAILESKTLQWFVTFERDFALDHHFRILHGYA